MLSGGDTAPSWPTLAQRSRSICHSRRRKRPISMKPTSICAHATCPHRLTGRRLPPLRRRPRLSSMGASPDPIDFPEPAWLAGASDPVVDGMLEELSPDARQLYRRYLTTARPTAARRRRGAASTRRLGPRSPACSGSLLARLSARALEHSRELLGLEAQRLDQRVDLAQALPYLSLDRLQIWHAAP